MLQTTDLSLKLDDSVRRDLPPHLLCPLSPIGAAPDLSPINTFPDFSALRKHGQTPPPPEQPMRILVCPSGFKESLDPQEAADCIEQGLKRVVPDAEIRKVPIFDGGEGTAKGLVFATGGELRYKVVTGPTGEPVESHFGYLGGTTLRTAVVEMAAAAGLSLVPTSCRDPTRTTSYGVGELICAALDDGAERILIGCGDSGTSDGGIGACQALGIRFLDSKGQILPVAAGAASLCDLASIDFSEMHPGILTTKIDVACNMKNLLCGPKGVARVYGPQKGATPAQVEQLASILDNFASVTSKQLGMDVALRPGSGASGGLGAGLLLMGAKLRHRYDVLAEYLAMDDLFGDSQLVFTAEGGIDSQTVQGKIPAEIGVRAKKMGLPVIALAGSVGEDASENYKYGIDAFTSMLDHPTTLEEAIQDADKLLANSAESTMRILMVGRLLGQMDSIFN